MMPNYIIVRISWNGRLNKLKKKKMFGMGVTFSLYSENEER